MKIRIPHIIVALMLTVGAIVLCTLRIDSITAVVHVLRGGRTTTQRIRQFGDCVRVRLAPDLERIAITWPPAKITLVGLKHEKTLEVWVSDGDKGPNLLKSYPILGASGDLGPNLRQGDM